MMATSLITQGTFRHLLTYKEHAVEMVEPIIKDTDLDPYAKQTTEKLGASGLFDLSRVRLFFFNFLLLLFIHLLTVVLFLGAVAYEGTSR